MGANKNEKAIQRMSKAAGGVRTIVDAFEQQVSVKQKSSAHAHRFSDEDEKKILADLHKLKPFLEMPGGSHEFFVGISQDSLAKPR